MIYALLGGVLVGFVLSFLVIKVQIKKDGAGQLKCCQTCPYFKTGESEEQ